MRVVIRFCRIDIKIVISDFSVVQGKKGTRSSGWKGEWRSCFYSSLLFLFFFFFFFKRSLFALLSLKDPIVCSSLCIIERNTFILEIL